MGTMVNTTDHPTHGYYLIRSASAVGWVKSQNLEFKSEPSSIAQPKPVEKRKSSPRFDFTIVGSIAFSSLSTDYNSSNDTAIVSGNTFSNEGLSSGIGIGAGVLISKTISPRASIETGLLYVPRMFSQAATIDGMYSLTTDYTYTYLEIPVLWRFHFLDYFSAGLGGYFAHAVGDIAYDERSTPPLAIINSTTQFEGFEGNDISRTDYGPLLALGGKFPIFEDGTSVYFDARYALGLKNINNGAATTLNQSNPPDNNKWRDVQVLLGLSFEL